MAAAAAPRNGYNSYHQYSQLDFTLLDQRLGDKAQLRDLTEKAHSLGLYVAWSSWERFFGVFKWLFFLICVICCGFVGFGLEKKALLGVF